MRLLWGTANLSAFLCYSVKSFVQADQEAIKGSLSAALIKRFSGDHGKQVDAWEIQLSVLRDALQKALETDHSVSAWGILLEYPLLRLQRRLDVVLLCGHRVVVVEFKVNAQTYAPSDARQVEDYALDLRDFHDASHNLNIIPVLCATDAPDEQFLLDGAPGVAPTCHCNRITLGKLFERLATNGPQINLKEWDSAAYRPVPSIIEAAELLYADHDVKEIAHASSDPTNLTSTTDRLIEIIADAQKCKKCVVVFVTGVPGSGKTLVGLNAIHDLRFRAEQ